MLNKQKSNFSELNEQLIKKENDCIILKERIIKLENDFLDIPLKLKMSQVI